MPPCEERRVGGVYQSESGMLLRVSPGGIIKKLCRDCLKNGDVTRQPNYKDENGKHNILCDNTLHMSYSRNAPTALTAQKSN